MILDDFESFIKFRIGTGYAGYAMNYAKRYAQFLYSNYGNEEEVTEEMLQEYLKLHPHNNHNTYANAIAEIRTFSKYINQTGRKAYIPDKDYTYWKKRTEFIPYLLMIRSLRCSSIILIPIVIKICMNEELIEKLFFQFYTE